jgi:hypothetical protein
MTRSLFVFAGLLLILIVGSVAIGFASNAPGLLIMGFLCASPLFMLILGAALGRASNEFVIQRKSGREVVTNRESNPRIQRIRTQEPLS